VIGKSEKGKFGELYVFRELLKREAMPFIPLVDVHGIDAVVRQKNGNLVEIQIKATWPPEQAGYFNVRNLIERGSLFVVGLIMDDEPPQAWIIPSKEFVKHTTVREKGTVHLLSLGLGETKLEKSRREKLSEYFEAWHLLTG